MPIHAYVLNLKRRPDRADRMSQILERQGIPFELVPALDYTDPEVMAEVERRRAIPGGIQNRGAIACTMSHEVIWQRIADSHAQHAVVFEDDIVVADDLAATLADPALVPADADIVKLETYLKARTRYDRSATTVVGRYGVHRLRAHSMGAAAYLITRKAAVALLARPLPARVIDWILFDEIEGLLNELTVYQMVPAPVAQGSVLIQKRDWPSDPIYASDIKPVMAETDRTLYRPRPPFTVPDDRKLLLTRRFGLSRRLQSIERSMRTQAFRALWRLRGQSMGAVPFALDGQEPKGASDRTP